MKMLRYRPAVANFGDDLNDILWPALAPALFRDEAHGPQPDDAAWFVGIGTIIGMPPGVARRLHVFSSGIGYAPVAAWRGLQVDYHCVRGPISARVLGLESHRALTDGAILAPLLPELAGGAVPQAGTVVVPHYETIAFPGWDKAARLAGMRLVDPRGTPAEVIRALRGAQLVLTESLHGAILADSFGVPWVPFAVSGNFSTAKWADWAASLDLRIAVTMVVPPDPMPLLRFGRRAEPFGTRIAIDPEAALGEFRSRVAPARQVSRLKRAAKAVLEGVPPARALLGYSPDRTAEHLLRLAQASPWCSAEARRDTLRAAMRERLETLVRAQDALCSTVD
ncbi:hypothetical protein GCM10011614_25190 [Novosphingobium colocasiae]|uniref:Polysaccharide pyruvyl transferase domain-containing protein n=2 Tax=Novosphingobium colocasiae TaxID=1256513 RepID=A0A918PHA3_9SPHN|nr:hypothetical protein GCM10011614_25190 [Novosphingobium colocasiae]